MAQSPALSSASPPLERLLQASLARLAQPLEPFRLLDEHGRPTGDFPVELSDQQLQDAYRWMLFARELDGRALQLQRQGRLGIWGPTAGQEATQVGLGLAMTRGDWLFPSYREWTTLCLRGLDIAVSLNYLRGLYWLADPHETGVFPPQIVIGDQTLHAVGAGMAFALRDEPRVAVAAVGDGATSQGDFLEALNFAGVYRARSVIFIQNNHWAISLHRAQQTASDTLAQKALAFGLPGLLVDGNDLLAVYAACRWALEHARSGAGPVLVEALTYRLGAHTTADDPRRYQPPEEIEAWRARDPLPRFRRFLEGRRLWDDDSETRARAEALAEVEEAIRRAESTPAPPFERVFETTVAPFPHGEREPGGVE